MAFRGSEKSVLCSLLGQIGELKTEMGAPRLFSVILMQFLSGFLENLSIFALLPIIYVALGAQGGEDNHIYRLINEFFAYLGLKLELGVLLGFFVILVLLKSVFSFLAYYLANLQVLLLAKNYRDTLIGNIFRAKWSFFSYLKPGKYGNIMTGEIEKTKACISGTFIFLNALILTVLYGISSLFISWKLFMAALLLSGVSLLFLNPLIKQNRTASHKNSSVLNNLTAFMANTISGIKNIKAMGIEDKSRDILLRDNQTVYETAKTTLFAGTMMKTAQQPVVAISLAVTILMSVYLLHVPIANLAILLVIFNRSQVKILEIQSALQRFVNGEGGYLNVKNAIEDAKEYLEAQQTEGGEFSLEKSIEIRGLSTRAAGHDILSDVNLTIPARGFNVFYGPSGGGKTTLIDTIIGLREDFTGDIFFDGRSMREIPSMAIRSHVGYVAQDLQLFHTSIRDNVKIAYPQASDDEIWQALEMVNAREFVEKLEEGLDTIVGESSSVFSGGQRQRILLARAMIRKPQILVLDEATSALDAENTEMIIGLVRSVARQACVLMISHDADIVDIADHAFEIKDGRAKQVK